MSHALRRARTRAPGPAVDQDLFVRGVSRVVNDDDCRHSRPSIRRPASWPHRSPAATARPDRRWVAKPLELPAVAKILTWPVLPRRIFSPTTMEGDPVQTRSRLLGLASVSLLLCASAAALGQSEATPRASSFALPAEAAWPAALDAPLPEPRVPAVG